MSRRGVSLEKLQRIVSNATAAESAESPVLRDIQRLLATGLHRVATELTASSVDFDTVVRVFGLFYEKDETAAVKPKHIWHVKHSEALSRWLSYGLHLHAHLVDSNSEASCRSLIDLILMDSLSSSHPTVFKFERWMQRKDSMTIQTENIPMDGTQVADTSSRLPLKAFGEMYMTMFIGDYKCTGYADYVIGYRRNLNSLFAIVEAKKGTPYNPELTVAQTLFYLAMLRESRRRSSKQNYTVYGVATDSKKYCFLRIDNEGNVSISSQFNFEIPDERGKVLGFIKHILLCCEKSSPSSTPTLPGEAREREIGNFSLGVEAYHFDIMLDGFIEDVDETWMDERVA